MQANKYRKFLVTAFSDKEGNIMKREIGKYLCRQYYTGHLKCSVSYHTGSPEYFLSRCVEIPLEDTKGTRGRLGVIWRRLVLGDYAKLNQSARSRVMGGRAGRDGENSLDGGSLHELELVLWDAVGEEFERLIREVERERRRSERGGARRDGRDGRRWH